MTRIIIFIAIFLCVGFEAGAQAFTHSYLERADSADRYIKMERWDDAERNLKDALRLEPANPGNALLLSNLGYVQTMLGKTDDALLSYDVSLSIAPRSAVVLSNRALTYIFSGKKDKAMADLNASLAIDSTRAMPLRWRGMLRLEEGDFEGARHDFNMLLRTDNKSADAYDGLTQCAIHDANFDRALEFASKALQIEPTAERYFTKASIEIDTSRLPEATETLRAAIKEFDRNPELYLLRAKLHELNYRREDCELDKKTALELGLDPQLLLQYFPK